MDGNILDVFNNDAFSAIQLTDAFNVVPNKYGRLQELNLFPARGVRTRTIAIERKNFVLNLLPSVPVGGPATKGTIGKRDIRSLPIPHIPHEDVVLAEDVQGVRAFGQENMLASLQDLLNEKLQTMADKHDITLEFLRWGALKGMIFDASGSLLLDLFAEFGVTQEVQAFALSNGATEVMTKILNLKRYMEQNLFGDTMSGVYVFCSSDFFDALTTHASIKAAYQFYQSTLEPLRNDNRSRFTIGGVTFEEHVGRATTADGTVHQFIPDGEAIAFPLGSTSFGTYFAPADFMETVNTPGLARYAKQERLRFDRGIEIHTQSNPLPIVRRPQLLVRITEN